MLFMAQITILRPQDFDLVLYLSKILPNGCKMHIFTDAHLTDQTNIFIYGERTHFHALEAMLQLAKKKTGIILADFVWSD
jgi:hypothetical protein